MPQVRNSLEPICGRVAETGDLTKPIRVEMTKQNTNQTMQSFTKNGVLVGSLKFSVMDQITYLLIHE